MSETVGFKGVLSPIASARLFYSFELHAGSALHFPFFVFRSFVHIIPVLHFFACHSVGIAALNWILACVVSIARSAVVVCWTVVFEVVTLQCLDFVVEFIFLVFVLFFAASIRIRFFLSVLYPYIVQVSGGAEFCGRGRW